MKDIFKLLINNFFDIQIIFSGSDAIALSVADLERRKVIIVYLDKIIFIIIDLLNIIYVLKKIFKKIKRFIVQIL